MVFRTLQDVNRGSASRLGMDNTWPDNLWRPHKGGVATSMRLAADCFFCEPLVSGWRTTSGWAVLLSFRGGRGPAAPKPFQAFEEVLRLILQSTKSSPAKGEATSLRCGFQFPRGGGNGENRSWRSQEEPKHVLNQRNTHFAVFSDENRPANRPSLASMARGRRCRAGGERIQEGQAGARSLGSFRRPGG